MGLGQGTPELARRVADIASIALNEYQLGVQAGRVVSAAELEEARLFLQEARRSAEGLPGAAAGSALELLDTLIAGVEAREPFERLAPKVAALRTHLSAALGVELDPFPTNPPALARGRDLYGARCASCHGDVGRGDGPAASGLNPPPADLTAPALRGSSPLEFYRKINVGVAGTAMPAFSAQLGSDDRWALALYASGLRYSDAERERGERLLREQCPGCLVSISGFTETAASSDDSLAAVLGAEVGRTPDDPLVREAVAYARTSGAAEVLGSDRRLRVARTVAETRRGMASAVRWVEAGERARAVEQLVDAYLVFERIEGELRARRPQAAGEVERRFAELRGAAAEAPLASVHAAAERLDRSLTHAADELAAATSPKLLFAQSLLIMLREGFEAILVIGALVAFLVRAGAADRKREIGLGVVWAIGASLLTAAGYATIFRNATASQEALEGLTMLVAAAVLFWVSYWLVSKIELKKWQAFVAARMGKALSSRSALALAAVAFLAVYREGFETVLFYAALFASAGRAPGATAGIASGIVLGLAGLGVVYYLMQRYGPRLPLKPFFAVTSALLYLMAFSFAGQGISELQAAGYVPATPLSWVPTIPALGIFPTLQSFLLQGLLVAAVAAALVWVFWLEPRARAPEAGTA
ncbi:MAG: FTR1 family protein [Gemmatimonadetes bacterium]|nr:FTR1 family protein [Gemmatimonadota bacterium]